MGLYKTGILLRPDYFRKKRSRDFTETSYPKAVYTNCMAHHLNLYGNSVGKMQSFWNIFDTVGR